MYININNLTNTTQYININPTKHINVNTNNINITQYINSNHINSQRSSVRGVHRSGAHARADSAPGPAPLARPGHGGHRDNEGAGLHRRASLSSPAEVGGHLATI